MKILRYIAMSMLAASVLSAQSLQEIADALPAPTLDAEKQQLVLPQAPGVQVELGGVDYEQLLDRQGKVARGIIADTPVKVFLRVSKDGQAVDSPDYEITLPANVQTDKPAGSNAKPAVVPAILQWKGGEGQWKPQGSELRVGGAAGIEFAKEALSAATGLPVRDVDANSDNQDIKIELGEAGLDNEGYHMIINSQRILIRSESRDGVVWAIRTLQQILRTHDGAVPCGEIIDMPRYAVRGFVLDAGRAPYTISELRDVINTMSWYKMNDLHLVINNNFIFHERYVDAGRDPFKESYAAFRLESSHKGVDGTPLTASDVFYSKKEFAELVDYARQRGVRIVPEFDTPGHALAFTHLRPDLIYKGAMNHHEKRRCEMLDAANPETLAFVEGVLDEYLLPQEDGKEAVLDKCDVIHVGADEFFGDAEDYRKYADGLVQYVKSRHHTPRIWGSLSSKRGQTPVTSQGVQLNLWNSTWMSAREAIQLGFDVINTNDAFLYIVPYAKYYRADRNMGWLYEHWQPHMMYAEKLPAGHPQLLGAACAVWNDTTDLLHNGYGMIDIWPIISGSLSTLCQKMWGLAQPPDTYQQHCELVRQIGPAPDSNPMHHPGGMNAITLHPEQLPMQLNMPDLGPAYHLTVELELSDAPAGKEQVLLSSPIGQLIAVMKDGCIGFRRADGVEFAYEAKLPVGKRVKLELIATSGNTKLLLDGQPITRMRLNTFLSVEENFHPRTKGLVSTFVLPLQTLAPTLNGKVYSLDLRPLEQ